LRIEDLTRSLADPSQTPGDAEERRRQQFIEMTIDSLAGRVRPSIRPWHGGSLRSSRSGTLNKSEDEAKSLKLRLFALRIEFFNGPSGKRHAAWGALMRSL
jgi:hypothetical protein